MAHISIWAIFFMSTLTQARLRELIHYNPMTGQFSRSGRVVGSLSSSSGYIHIMVDGKLYQAHRLAWLYVKGKWPDNQIDHKNGCRSDNRIANLREATHSENMRNRKGWSRGGSGHIGVVWHTKAAKWQVYLCVKKKNHYIGIYTQLDDAIRARQEAEKRLHGEFAQHTSRI